MPDTERQRSRVFSSLLENVVSLNANGEQRVCSRLERVLTPATGRSEHPRVALCDQERSRCQYYPAV
jgi:hypothetical protein